MTAEVLPDPGNALSGYKYLVQEAESGTIASSSDLLVLHYLWTFAWRKNDDRLGRVRGLVETSRTSCKAIARGTLLSVPTVKRVLKSLRDTGWIRTEHVGENWRAGDDIWVRIDPEGASVRARLGITVIPDWDHDDPTEADHSSYIYKGQLSQPEARQQLEEVAPW